MEENNLFFSYVWGDIYFSLYCADIDIINT